MGGIVEMDLTSFVSPVCVSAGKTRECSVIPPLHREVYASRWYGTGNADSPLAGRRGSWGNLSEGSPMCAFGDFPRTGKVTLPGRGRARRCGRSGPPEANGRNIGRNDIYRRRGSIKEKRRGQRSYLCPHVIRRVIPIGDNTGIGPRCTPGFSPHNRRQAASPA